MQPQLILTTCEHAVVTRSLLRLYLCLLYLSS
jgi:hypothetical protein